MRNPEGIVIVVDNIHPMTSRQSILANAFSPGTETDRPALFPGREGQVQQLAHSLHTAGEIPIIYGDRGLGKSSLAIQIQRVAMGDLDLLSRLGLDHLGFEDDQTYTTFFVACSDAVTNKSGILQRLINSAEGVALESNGGSQLIDRTTKKKVSLKVFQAEEIKHFEERTGEPTYTSLDLEEKLNLVAQLLVETTGQRVLFIVDELDRVGDTAGLASFLKNSTSEYLRFMLVGIAQSTAELISDHQSLDRIVVPTEVPRMSPEELRQIVANAMAGLAGQGIDLAFEPEATEVLINLSGGFPWFVHVIGQAAIVGAEEAAATTITRAIMEQAVRTLTANRFTQQYSDRYQQAVRDSEQREKVLRMFAHWGHRDIPTAGIYEALRSPALGVANPSVYKGHLASEPYGPVLVTPPFQEWGVVRFADEMFKHYVRIRPSLYEGLDSAVRRAFAAMP